MIRKLVKRISSKSLFENIEEYDKVAKIQAALLTMWKQDSELFDELDVQNIIWNKVYLHRFLLRQHGNVKKTIEMVKETLIWRKEKRIPHIIPSAVPREIYDLGPMITHGTDRDGNVVLYIRLKCLFVIEETKESNIRLLMARVFSTFEEGLANNKGFVLFYDATDVTMANYHLAEALDAFRIFQKYVPSGLTKIVFYNLTWYARSLIKPAFALLQNELRKMLHFVNKNDVDKIISPKSLPPFITDPATKYKIPRPPDVKDIDHCDLELIGVKLEDREAYKAFIEKLLDYYNIC
ncbi:Motile sperm domain-containing protein 2-like protein [Dinothrombium tinctorium]|uniref:Motile sperm domain-containing protein 2-like protein n=1 Tax=Dinothrombium tinctorium TaxID=1965070 RepID=A0A3S3P761_9ACAR|nr:Motile sperm domain-containing protein 2-like protein [Dinothrombium tinctorium]